MRNVFLSYTAEDLPAARLLREMVKRENLPLNFCDYLVDEAFDSYRTEYIRTQIRALIRSSSVTMCLIGSRTHASPWVDWELSESIAMGKGLLGVWILPSKPTVAPVRLPTAGAAIVEWDLAHIARAIERAARRAGY